jgi:hypothetical protein
VPSSAQHERADLADVVLLAAILVVSCAPYVHKLGFYSDDWAFLASLSGFGDLSHVGRPEIIEWSAYLKPRPVQIGYQELLFFAFGMQPLGYHIVNSAVLVAGGVLFQLALRRLGTSRAVAFAVPVVYALLPHYSTDRFWFAAFGYPLAMLCCFTHLYANLRATTATSRSFASWKAIGLAAATIGAFGYEIAIPLLAVNLVVVTWRQRAVTPRYRSNISRFAAFWSMDVAVLIAAFLFKATIPGGVEAPPDVIIHSARLVTGSIAISFGTYGVALAEPTRWGVAVAGIPTLVATAMVAIAVFVTMMRCTEGSWLRPRAALQLATAGMIVFFVGYSVFVLTTRIYFTSTGISNRVAIAGTAGVAMVMVAGAFLISCLCRSELARRTTVSLLVAGVCAAGAMITTGLADRWSLAWEREQEVLELMSDVRVPDGASVLLDGLCPYVGPAPVFESNWDLTGALEILYDDPTIDADVTTTRHSLDAGGISTQIYGSIRARYPYGQDLLLVEYPEGRTTALSNRRTAVMAIGDEPRLPDGCERGIAGAGQTLFSFDRIYHDLENRYLWP